MTEDKQYYFEFHRKVVKINGMATGWDVFDHSDKELKLDALKYPEGIRFPNSKWRNDEEIASGAVRLILQMFFIPTMIVTILETELIGKLSFKKKHILTNENDLCFLNDVCKNTEGHTGGTHKR